MRPTTAAPRPAPGPVRTPGGRRLHGRSLVELMVSITIGLAVVAAVAAAFVSAARTAQHAAGLGDVADSGRTVLHWMGDAVRQAGHGEIVGSEMGLGPADPASLRSQTLFGDGPHLGGCTGARLVDDTADVPVCGPAGDPALDTLFVRFQGATVIAPPQGAVADCLGAAVPDEPLPPDHAGLARVAGRPMVRNVYFGDDDRLWCRGNGRAAIGDPFAAPQALATGVEQFKVFYGFDDARHAGRGTEASGSVRSLRDAAFLNALPPATNPWDFVISVHLCVVVRSAAADGAPAPARRTFARCPVDAQEAAGPLVEVPAPDGALRRTFTQVYVVRARSPADPKEFLP